MLSQAEHDAMAASIVITTDVALAEKVAEKVAERVAVLPRREIAASSLERKGMIIVADDMAQALDFANTVAPEHLELLTKEPASLLPFVKNAGAVFLGAYSPEPLGDYAAGPSHVLPTGGTARFYSVLNVETFMKRVSVISATKDYLQELAADIVTLAEAEGLRAHAEAIKLRGSGA